MQVHRDELLAIAEQAEAPSFDNTVAAFDRAGRLLGRIESVFFNLTASETSPALQAVQREMAGPLAAHANSVYMNATLFARIDALHEARAALGLSPEQLRLLERIHFDFVSSGARLQGPAQARFTCPAAQLRKKKQHDIAEGVVRNEEEEIGHQDAVTARGGQDTPGQRDLEPGQK